MARKNLSRRLPKRKKTRNEVISKRSQLFIPGFSLDNATLASVKKFQDLDEQKKTAESSKIVSDTIIEATADPNALFPFAIEQSQSLLAGYATLDLHHRAQIRTLIEQITDYLRDPTRKRPFNALMLAAPGAGKSHFIKQLAAAMGKERVQAVTFNMATMQSTDDMAQPIDELRNLKVNDRFPLLFLDEFDSDASR